MKVFSTQELARVVHDVADEISRGPGNVKPRVIKYVGEGSIALGRSVVIHEGAVEFLTVVSASV